MYGHSIAKLSGNACPIESELIQLIAICLGRGMVLIRASDPRLHLGPSAQIHSAFDSKPSPRFGLWSQHIEKQEINGGVRIVYDAIRHLSPPSEDFYRIF
jgi:hypothetical protein